MRESKIERELVERVKQAGGMAYKLVSPGNNGMPDRLVIFPDQSPIFVELKTEKGVLRRMQKRQIKRLVDLGQDVDLLRSAKRSTVSMICEGGHGISTV